MRIIRSFDDVLSAKDRSKPVVTMFSGGLDSTFLLHRLAKAGFSNVKAVAVDVGEPIDAKAMTACAARFEAHFVLLAGQQRFVAEAVRPAISAQAKYLGVYPLSSSLSRPIIADMVSSYAVSVGARMLLHTANRSQNSLPRLNNSIARHDYAGQYGSPYEGSVLTRRQKAAELAEIGVSFVADRRLSGDENLWCREFESGPLDDPENFAIPEDVFTWTRRATSPAPGHVDLTFREGTLCEIDGQHIDLIDAIAHLNGFVGRYGHGRFVGLEHLEGDEKVLEVREAPAALILMDALRHLEIATLDTRSMVLKQRLEQEWAQEAVAGRWHGTTRQICDHALQMIGSTVNGTVRYAIDTRRFLPTSIVAQAPRYIRDRDAWEIQTARAKRLQHPTAAQIVDFQTSEVV